MGGIVDVVRQGCQRYNQLVVSDNADIVYFPVTTTSEPNRMTPRLADKLDLLAQLTLAAGLGNLIVREAYMVPPAQVTTPTLHYEGRAADVAVTDTAALGALAQLALEAELDFVHYADAAYVHVSVIPEPCQKPLDIVFLLDGSGSINNPSFGGADGNFQDKVLGFVSEVVARFTVGQNDTRVGIATFSNSVTINYLLNSEYDKAKILAGIPTIAYPALGTRTSDGLHTVRTTLFQEMYGMRPLAAGVSRVLVVITDGKANTGYAPKGNATLLHNSNVNVFAMGVGTSIDLGELEDIASGDGNSNVFLIKSFDRIASFVDSLTRGTCEAPALITAGEQTTTTVGDCEWLYFSPACQEASNLNIVVTVHTGNVHVYLSRTTQLPGPFDNSASDTSTNRTRVFTITRSAQDSAPVFVGIQGASGDGSASSFSIDVWSDIFNGLTHYTAQVSEAAPVGTLIFTPPPVTGTQTNLVYELTRGNTAGAFSINAATGVVKTAAALDRETIASYNLGIRARDQQLACLSGGMELVVNLLDVDDTTPTFTLNPYTLGLPEDTPVGALVETIQATDADAVPPAITYALVFAPDRRRAADPFVIDPQSGELRTNAALDFETQPEYHFTVTATDAAGHVASAAIDVSLTAVPCPAASYSATGTVPCTVDPPCGPTQWQAAPTTATTPRVCSSPQTCVTGQTYMTTDFTPTTDRVCSPVTPCNSATHYQTAAPTPTTNYVCAPLTACTAGQYIQVAHTATTDRQCADLNDCQSNPCANGGTCTDGIDSYSCACATPFWGDNCECGPTTYTPTGASPCFPFSSCTLGATYETQAPTASTDRVCSPTTPCTAAQYETTAATLLADRLCLPLTPCAAGQYQSVAPTPTTNRQCANVKTCGADEDETAAPTPTTDRACAWRNDCSPNPCLNGGSCTDGVKAYTCQCPPGYFGLTCECSPSMYRPAPTLPCVAHTPCLPTEFETVAPTPTTDRTCTTLTVCSPLSHYQSVAPTLTTDRQCAPLTPCGAAEFQSLPPTAVADRQCATITTCTVDQTATQEPTPTTDRVCVDINDCQPNPCQNGGVCFDGVRTQLGVPSFSCQCPGNYQGDLCDIFDACKFANCVAGVCQNTLAGAVCVCSDPTCTDACCDCTTGAGTADNTCLTSTEAKQRESEGSDNNTSLLPLMVVGGIIGAILAIFLLLLLARMHRRSRRDKAADPEQVADHDGTFNPLYAMSDYPQVILRKTNDGASNPIYGETIDYLPFMLGARPVYELALRNDPNWQDFRRCVSFDHQYYGNKCAALDDRAVKKIFRLLGMHTPPPEVLSKLRQVCDRFLAQQVSDESDPRLLGEVVEFLACALPDVLVELAIDHLAMLKIRQGQEVMYEAFYAAVDDYDPYTNPYLAPHEETGLFGPIYEDLQAIYDAGGEGGEYAEIDDQEEDMYALATNTSEYDEMNITSLPRRKQTKWDEEAIYSMGDDAGGEAIYNMADAGGEAIYNMADADGEAIYAMAGQPSVRHKRRQTKGYDGAENVYDMAAGTDDNIYSLGDADNEPLYDMPSLPLEDALDPEALAVMQSGGSLHTVLSRKWKKQKRGIPAEAIYDTASGATDPEAIYDVATTEDGEAIYDVATTEGGEAIYDTADVTLDQALGPMQDEDTEAVYSLGDDGANEPIYSVASKEQPAEALYARAVPKSERAYARASQRDTDQEENIYAMGDEDGTQDGAPSYDRAGTRYHQPQDNLPPAAYDQAQTAKPPAGNDTGIYHVSDAPNTALYAQAARGGAAASMPNYDAAVRESTYDVDATYDLAAGNPAAPVYDLPDPDRNAVVDDEYDVGAGNPVYDAAAPETAPIYDHGDADGYLEMDAAATTTATNVDDDNY